MNKKLILSALSLFLFVSASVAQSWSDEVIRTKKEIGDALSKAKMPVKTGIMRYKTSGEVMNIDVTGLDELVLYCWGTEDGNDYDQGAWGNAKLIAADGSETYLDKMSFKSVRAPHDSPRRNVGFGGRPLSVNGKAMERGICVHANGEIVIDLGKKYKTFQAEVGVDDGAGTPASMVFMVQNISPNAYADRLISKYPSEASAIMAVGNLDASAWLLNTDGTAEKTAANNVISKLNDPSFYKKQVDAVSGNADQKIREYIRIFEEARAVFELQGKFAWLKPANVRKAFNDMKGIQGYNASKYEPKVAELEQIFSSGINIYGGEKAQLDKAEKALTLSREILLSNPALDADKIILGKYNIGAAARTADAPALGTQPNNWSNQTSSSRQGFNAEIAEISNLRGNEVKYRTIYKPKAKVAVADLMLHWDADRLLFTSISDRGLWNIFEVKTDGTGLREIIKVDDSDLEFFDGTYLPSGKFIANSNIGYQGVPCVDGSDAVGNMVVYNEKDQNMRRITFDQDANWHPVVMNNGKVMYVRWEYTDLTHYFSRITMHMNPDGTEQKSLYGSGGFFPNSTFDVQPLPNSSSKFVGIVSGHHGVARSGRLMVFDPSKSRKKTEGIVQEIPFSTRPIDPIIKDELVNGVWPQFIKPSPIGNNYFLVTAKLTPESLWGIYLVDIFDNVTLIAESEGEGLINANLVVKRPTPPVIPDRVKLDEKEATVYIQDIYEGEGLPGVPRGTVKKLRLFAYEYAYLHSPSNHYAQGIQSGWDIKRLLGEVDVNEDGSATFKIPANTPVSMQPLDSEGRALQWMRSWVTGMPGETVSCVGCHEDQNSLPMPKASMASKQAPKAITPWEGGVRSYTFDLEVQPILDRACVACHNEKSGLNFTGGRTDDLLNFSKSYLAFHPYVNRQGPEADALVMKPYEYHASTSEIVRILKTGHHGVQLTDKEWRSLYAWIDMNAPYHGAFKQNDLNGYNQIQRRQELAMKYNNIQVDWQKEIADYATLLESKGEITPVKPDYTAPSYKEVTLKGWPIEASQAKELQNNLGDTRREIEIAPGIKMVFRKIPAGQFIMGSNKYGKDCAPESRVKIDKAFWMAEIEVTNEQYKALVPSHDSRYIAQFWKDHTGPGYAANEPKQPVIRVSYNQAMEYCKALSEKTGMNITIPTEAQWEWAARSGSASEFWFGNLNTDFAKYDNMADAQLEKMAVSGVDPQPMSKKSRMFPYYDYLPKSANVDDGSMLLVASGKYEANPWGLYDMHGNVEEWTSSDYVPYPYSDKPKVTAEEKVVRGGSWIDRAKNSTSYSRKAYYPWQPANNVGIRLIIEE